VAEWLSRGQTPYWKFSAEWLTERGVEPPFRTEEGVATHIQWLEKLRVWS
jgi:hypothetical protein